MLLLPLGPPVKNEKSAVDGDKLARLVELMAIELHGQGLNCRGIDTKHGESWHFVWYFKSFVFFCREILSVCI